MSIIKWIVKARELIMVVKFKYKKTVEITLDGFYLILKKVYASKSKTNDGNKPNAILSTIAITATA
jgi:hypothetical protein